MEQPGLLISHRLSLSSVDDDRLYVIYYTYIAKSSRYFLMLISTDDATAHLSEELHDAAVSGPVAIFQAVIVSWVSTSVVFMQSL
jgi:hypothetical protein